jgi:SAM-dependent methyltransferase
MNRYGEVFAKFYDRYFSDYAENAAPVLLRFFSSQHIFAKNPRVLDLGCGTGRLALRFLEAGYSLTGLELSPHMVDFAAAKCARFLVTGKAVFIQADISHFQRDNVYGLAVSTYNVMNHLDTEEKLRGCFQSVKRCLDVGGWFLFDYHTAVGLRSWAYSESIRFEEGEVDITACFDEKASQAAIHLKGVFQGEPFEETISNRVFSLERVASLLREEGFSQICFTRMDDLETPLQKPEEEKRVAVMSCV